MWWLPVGDYPAQVTILSKDSWTKPLALFLYHVMYVSVPLMFLWGSCHAMLMYGSTQHLQ